MLCVTLLRENGQIQMDAAAWEPRGFLDDAFCWGLGEEGYQARAEGGEFITLDASWGWEAAVKPTL